MIPPAWMFWTLLLLEGWLTLCLFAQAALWSR